MIIFIVNILNFNEQLLHSRHFKGMARECRHFPNYEIAKRAQVAVSRILAAVLYFILSQLFAALHFEKYSYLLTNGI